MDELYWYAEWDKSQTALVDYREERFSVMIDILRSVAVNNIRVLDLGCGPGSTSLRVLESVDKATVVSVDYDPVLLKIARRVLNKFGSGSMIVEADLSAPGWEEKLPLRSFDAVVSTTALHWINENALEKLYKHCFEMLSPNGIFLNGEHIHPAAEDERVKMFYDSVRHRMERENLRRLQALDWDAWWKSIGNDPMFSKEMKIRSERYGMGDHDKNVTLERHMDLLRRAGFSLIDVVWKALDNRILMAVK